MPLIESLQKVKHAILFVICLLDVKDFFSPSFGRKQDQRDATAVLSSQSVMNAKLTT